MADLGEVRMEQNEQRPVVVIMLPTGLFPDIHVPGERDVLDHDQEVGDGQAGEDGVGRGAHVRSGEDDDVEEVGDGAEETDHQAHVAVVRAVRVVEPV